MDLYDLPYYKFRDISGYLQAFADKLESVGECDDRDIIWDNAGKTVKQQLIGVKAKKCL